MFPPLLFEFDRSIEPKTAPFDPPTPKNLASERPKMEWIGCTICEIFAFKLYCDLESAGVRGHSRSSKAALFDRAHTTLYSSSTVNTVFEILLHIARKLLPSPCIRRSRQIYAATLGDEKLE